MNNQKTLESYEEHIAEYIEHTPSKVPKDSWLDYTLNKIQKEKPILEIGSGFGRDALYAQAKGYRVDCSEATRGFVSILRSKNIPTFQLNVLTQPIPLGYEAILANAVFLHFTRKELESVLIKCQMALPAQGILAFTLKKGFGEEWSNKKLGAPRYFCYWQSKQIKDLLQGTGFQILHLEEETMQDATWINIVAQKI